MTDIVADEPLAKIEYIKAVDVLTVEDVDVIDRPVLVAMAVYIGRTRLIDNFSFNPADKAI